MLLVYAAAAHNSVCPWWYARMQGKNYIFSIKQTYRPVNPDGCSVIASKTKKNILITIAVRQFGTVLYFACVRLFWKWYPAWKNCALCDFALRIDIPTLCCVYALICQAIFLGLLYMLNIMNAAQKLWASVQVLMPTEQPLTSSCWCRKPTVTHRRRSIGVTCSADYFLLSLWAASSTLGWHRISVYTNFSRPSECSEYCMRQHDCCHAFGLHSSWSSWPSLTAFSACPHDDLFGWARVATTGNCNLDDASHTVFSSVATAGMASGMSVSSEWPACCILDLSILLGTGRGTATTIFVFWFQLQA